ncbi:MAG TPA: cytochrome c [Gaiellaceae bacterium]|nr:cytochrome c [Gaiellaceae bacterium]
MLSTAYLIAGLSTGHKIGLAAVGAAFIAFALISSFVLPMRNPNFPGKRMGLYVTVCALFFIAMVAAVIILGKEQKEAKAEPPAATTTQTTTSSGGGTTQGDPAAGKTVFASAGCNGCHTLKAAGATGTVGPNLDQLKPPYARIVTQVTNGGGVMPKFGGQLSAEQIQDVAAYVFASTHQ